MAVIRLISLYFILDLSEPQDESSLQNTQKQSNMNGQNTSKRGEQASLCYVILMIRSLNGLITDYSLWNTLKNYSSTLDPLIESSYANNPLNLIRFISASSTRVIYSSDTSYSIIIRLSIRPLSIYYWQRSFYSSFTTNQNLSILAAKLPILLVLTNLRVNGNQGLRNIVLISNRGTNRSLN